jgi:hypothetical protein
VLAGLLCVLEWQRGMQNLLAADQGKQFLSQFPSVGQGKMYHEGHCDTGRVKILCLRVAAELHAFTPSVDTLFVL